jgi:rubredoxin
MGRKCLPVHAFLICPLARIDRSYNFEDTVGALSASQTWMCLICGWMYDEAAGDPDGGVAPGTAWADVPMNWVCPECGARKEDFEMVQI